MSDGGIVDIVIVVAVFAFMTYGVAYLFSRLLYKKKVHFVTEAEHIDDAYDATVDDYKQKWKLKDDLYVYLYEINVSEEKVKIRIVNGKQLGNLVTRKLTIINGVATIKVLGNTLEVLL